ncbi:quinone oxidoreductase family protein [Streptomyces indicus]|uniref:NADPH2:quinone reductase n=1 Tax=Streptomyces indicus TaxID=417292 RepID=A0A1G8ZS34_9ACTN|nr:zinc-binding alcohol dehydrogenase family protein [Streptomyces indicus]SDK17868.1 NADPH2:quinone reductase [Streptomyces indicus]
MSTTAKATATVNAAVIESFDEPPHYRVIPEPQPGPGQEVVDVLAVGVHRATKGIAAGKHYTSPTALPALAGADAVVRRADGSLGFVMVMGAGTLAERIAVDPAVVIPVPSEADPATLVATMNPALSSWVALKARVPDITGKSVLIIGATGNAGSMAVKVARHLGAGRVIAAGRNRARLDQLRSEGADEVIALTDDADATAKAYAGAAAEVDVVLDYVWGPPTELAMQAVLSARTEHTRLLDWVQIGGMGGLDITLAGHFLRSNAFRVLGSGFGSVAMEDCAFDELAAAITAGAMTVRPHPFPLAEVEAAWAHEDAQGERTVITL